MPSSPVKLFPEEIPVREWSRFAVSGFRDPVCGMIFDSEQPPCCGVALGGLGTGSLDIQADGVFGFCSAFPAPRRTARGVMPFYRNAMLLLPFLGMSVDGRTWVLATQKYIDGGVIPGCTEAYHPDGRHLEADPAFAALWSTDVPRAEGVSAAKKIRYFGHFPVADLEYETDAPVGVSLRAWAPFIPGDTVNSNIPGAVFEITLSNPARGEKTGCVAFSFPGPVGTKPEYDSFKREHISERGFTGIAVTANNNEFPAGYALGVVSDDASPDARFGGSLDSAPDAWSRISHSLPAADESTRGESVAVDFRLDPGESKTVRIILAWHSLKWQGAPYSDICGFDGPEPIHPYHPEVRDMPGHIYTAMYATCFGDAAAAARRLAEKHESLLARVFAWQQAVYGSEELPVWLRDCLVNNLNLIAKDSTWAAPDESIGSWTRGAGIFAMNECPRTCSIVGCIASNYYGDFPIAYFFPILERSLLRSYRENMRPDGAMPFLFPTGDVTRPAYKAMVGINGACFTDLVDRLWMRTGDDHILEEFYPAIKKNTIFTMEAVGEPEGPITLPFEGQGVEWWEYTPLYGMVTHFGGVRLAQLRMAERMAAAMGDEDFAARCRQWFRLGAEAMEKYLWNDDNYLLFNDPKSGRSDDTIMSSQLDGDWMAYLHGLAPVFPDDRAQAALRTIADTCVSEYGAEGFASRDKTRDVGSYGTFVPEIHMIGMTFIYRGFPELGLELSRRVMDDVVRVQGHGWDLPNMIFADSGKRFYGTDYFQNMMLWALPAAIAGTDLAGPSKPDGFTDRVILAGNQPKLR